MFKKITFLLILLSSGLSGEETIVRESDPHYLDVFDVVYEFRKSVFLYKPYRRDNEIFIEVPGKHFLLPASVQSYRNNPMKWPRVIGLIEKGTHMTVNVVTGNRTCKGCKRDKRDVFIKVHTPELSEHRVNAEDLVIQNWDGTFGLDPDIVKKAKFDEPSNSFKIILKQY